MVQKNLYHFFGRKLINEPGFDQLIRRYFSFYIFVTL